MYLRIVHLIGEYYPQK